MLDLNSLSVFEKVASLKSFTAAARTPGIPKSNVSPALGRLDDTLGTRLFQRTARDVMLTLTGQALLDRSSQIMPTSAKLSTMPGGHTLKISAGVGFGWYTARSRSMDS